MSRIVFAFLCVYCFQEIFANSDLIAYTKQGPIRGYLQPSSSGKDIVTFLGIPYSKPPVGPLRFQPPEPPEPWEGVRDGSKEGAFCIHYDYVQARKTVGKEDCLYLNIYTRKLPSGETDSKRPVMMWIHGGGFSFGTGSPIFYGPNFLMDHDIVLVSINYRLSSFGFLSTGDEACPGNMGLKDQNMALRWIKDNIAAFGGDSDLVTIFGESAGGASVHYHILSPMSRGLFHRAISQSGTVLCSWAHVPPKEALSRARRLGSVLGCKQEKSIDLMQCLRKVPGPKLAQAHTKLLEWYLDPVSLFAPTTELGGEEKLISKYPYELLLEGDVANVPWLTGVCDTEGEVMVAGISIDKKLMKEINEQHRKVFPVIFHYKHLTDKVDEVSEKIRQFYFGDKNITKETLTGLLKLYSDRFMNHGAYKAVILQRNVHISPIYAYELTFMGEYSMSKLMGKSSYQPQGVAHTDDMIYLFPLVIFPPLKEESPEKKMAEMMTAWWTNFAATGNPTPKNGKESKVPWLPLEKGHFNHFNINLEPHMQTEYYPKERLEFWNELDISEHEKYCKNMEFIKEEL